MIKKSLFFLLLFSAFSSKSQNFQWVKSPPITFSSNDGNISFNVTSDVTGNVYTMGYKNTPFPYGEILGTQFYNKYDSTGTLLFSNEIIGHATILNATTDSDGNVVLILGYVGNTSIGTFNILSTHQGVNLSVVKLDSSGTALWSRQFTLPSSTVMHASSVATDASDYIYVGYDNYQNSYIDKLTPSGALVFTITQTNVKVLSSASIDNEGNIYAAGACAESAATYASIATAPPVAFDYNVYVVKYSPTGTYQWVKYVLDISCSDAQVKAKTPDAIYFTSQLTGSNVFGTFTADGPSGTSSDVFIAKLNGSGTFQWVRELPGVGSLANGKRSTLDVDNLNNVYFGGKFSGTTTWGNNLTTTTGSSTGNVDAIVLKYDSDGQILMAKLAGGTAQDRVDAINIGNDGSINLCGIVKGSSNFDSIALSGNTGQTYPYVAKLSNGNLNTTNHQALEVVLYPNPSSDHLFFSNTTETVEGNLFNTLGQKIKSFSLKSGQPLSVSELTKGTYFVKLNGMKTMKFVKL